MTDKELQKMASWKVLELLFHQVNETWFYFQSDQVMFGVRPKDIPQPDGPLIGVGDFLIYPRFPAKKSLKTGQTK